MADNIPQNQTAAPAPNAGTTPDAKGQTPSTAGTAAAPKQTTPTKDPFEAALDAAFAEDAPATKKDEQQAPGSTTEGEPKPGEEPQGDQPGEGQAEGAEASTLTDEEVEAAVAADDLDPETPPKGLEGVPKGVWKRITNQSATIRDLKAKLAEGAVRIEPTPANPLADVTTTEELQERIADTKAKARSLRAKLKENPEGWTERGKGGKETEMTPEAVEQELETLQAEIEAAPDAHALIMRREQTKPWLAAEALVPGMLEKGTIENRYLLYRLQQCPEIATQIPDWELLLAHASIGARQAWEEANGKAKYVRYELDKDGKMIAPTPAKAAGGAKAAVAKTAAATTTKQPPVTPGAARPPLKAGNADAQKSTNEVLAGLPADASPEDRTRALVANAFA